MSRCKVIHLIGSMDLGGAQKLTRFTVEGLPIKEFDTQVWCIKEGGFNAEQLRKKGYCVKELLGIGKRSQVNLVMILKAAWRLFRLLRQEKPDLLHSHLFFPSCLARIVGKLAGVKHIVVTMHRIEYPSFQPWIERFFRPITDMYITDSYAIADLLSSTMAIPLNEIETIYNGIDRSEFISPPDKGVARKSLSLTDKEFVIGIVAHLSPAKGHSFLLNALAEIYAEVPSMKLLIIGDGILRERLEYEAKELLPDGKVIFIGEREDLSTMLSVMDVLVLPSSWEGFGIILAEAMYMRIPVITTKDGGGGVLK